MPKVTESTRAARRDQIISAALTRFAHSGYQATTMADVATEAGVSKGTPYLYFPSKEALFLALHEEWGCGLADRVDAAVAALSEHERRSPRRTLQAVADAVGANVLAHADTCRVLMEARTLAGYHPTIAEAVQAADTRTREQIENLIRAGIEAGEWRADTDPALHAQLFTATLHGLMAQWHLAPDSFSWAAAASAIATPSTRP